MTALVAIPLILIAVIGAVLFAPSDETSPAKHKLLALAHRVGIPDLWIWNVGLIPTDYPLGTFARVAHWTKVVSDLDNVRVDTEFGRPYFTFSGGSSGGGGLDLGSLVAGPIGKNRSWVAAIPLESGGSGGVFKVLVFEMVESAPTYLGSIDDGDSTTARINHGVIEVTTSDREPGACERCYTEVNVNDYQVVPTLHRTRHRELPVSTVTYGGFIAKAKLPSVDELRRHPVLNPNDSIPPISIPSDLSIPMLPDDREALIVSRRSDGQSWAAVATGIYAYHGGLDP